ncbi:hypothetical protein TPHA_0G03080 [Tetrapisispora phaffii CBS 4417]|uniref:Uncharacterized protein n=1 Tax=Tetrapisispora phaffii (strain ATCC 24235 / CBS 4417 / NBRC 1672 / NRRL Y-8282 / UCD 70-5) TaxID=1071381 RepID=G8BW71_TETPH|nr:hypothetical protein TPHA_0G03080 [Tetrapisispora phaffii CBS 4417]CCE64149.1 hypothetical protein TPHA_0G03080 [Tetrapisispora phaffii CBS 4417]
MDVCKFLDLPIDIRKNIYLQLNGMLGNSNFDSNKFSINIQETRTENTIPVSKKAKSNRKTRIQTYYKIFEPIFAMLNHSNLFEKWLYHAIWLRYDSIMLDCMRINHFYGGQVLGSLDWIQLDGKLRLAYFDEHYVLQVWYTFKEYNKWIVRGSSAIETESKIDYLRLNIDHLNSMGSVFEKTLDDFGKHDMYLKINEIHFNSDEDENAESDFLPNYNEDSVTDTEAENTDALDISFKNKLNDKNIIAIIQRMENMKNLSKLTITTDRLYQTLVNLQGVRDNPGRIISYMVRKRITEIQINRVKQLSFKSRIGDFGKWENLNRLELNNIQYLDMNLIYFPDSCKELVLKNIRILKWWNAEESLVPILFTESAHEQKKIWIKKQNRKKQVKEYRLNEHYLKPEIIENCKDIVKSMIGRSSTNKLNYISLVSINKTVNNFIIVPSNLYDNNRIQLFNINRYIEEVYII